MAVGRTELEKALDEGCAVLLDGHAETLKGKPRMLPPDRVEGQRIIPVVGMVVRDPQGRLTREGMELAIAHGGSVVWEGETIDSAEHLPTADDIKRADARRAQEYRRALLAQQAAIQAQLATAPVEEVKQEPQPSGPSEQERAEFEAWKRERDQRQQQQQQPPPQPEEPPAEDVPEAQPVEEEEMGFRKRRK